MTDHREVYQADIPSAVSSGAMINVDERLVSISPASTGQPGVQVVVTQAIYRSDVINYLGERCDGGELCASDLACRQSGESGFARCVMK